MGSLEMSGLELDSGGGRGSSTVSNDGKDESICFSKAEEGPCYSQNNSTADSSNHGHNSDSENDQVMHSRRVSSAVGTDCVVDIEKGVDEVRISLDTIERECRICLLSLDSESGIAIELGCSCKNELAAVHQHCAEQWFRSKGNKICEICKSIAQNVVIPNDIKSMQQIFEVNRFITNAIPMPGFERHTYSTSRVLPVSVFESDAISSNAVSASVSSTSDRAPRICLIFLGCLSLVLIFVRVFLSIILKM